MKKKKNKLRETPKFFPKDAAEFHQSSDYKPRPGWSIQKWRLSDNCCGDQDIEVILPKDWGKRVRKELANIKKVFWARTYPSLGDDGNSHLVYIESGFVLMQTLLSGEDSDGDDVTLYFAITEKGKYVYTVSTVDEETVKPTLDKALILFKKLNPSQKVKAT